MKNLVRAFTLLFMSLWAHPLWAANALNEVIAIVNDNIITSHALSQRLAQVKQQNPEGTLPPDAQLAGQVLSHLVTERVLLQHAEATGIQIAQPSLEAALQDVAHSRGQTLSELRTSLAERGIDYADFRQQIQQELMFSQLYRRDVASQVVVSDEEVSHFLSSPAGQEQMGLAYQFRHILVSLPSSPSPEAVLLAQEKIDNLRIRLNAGEDFASLAMAHSNGATALEGGDMGWRKAGELPSLFSDTLTTLSTGELSAPLRNASGFHLIQLVDKRFDSQEALAPMQIRHILLTAKPGDDDEALSERLTDYRNQLLDGRLDFATLAHEVSDDTASAQMGGDLGWVSPQSLTPTFLAEVEALETGTLSLPFKSPFGWHLAEVTSRDDVDPLASQRLLKEEAHRLLHAQKFEEQLEHWKRKLVSEAFIEVIEHHA